MCWQTCKARMSQLNTSIIYIKKVQIIKNELQHLQNNPTILKWLDSNQKDNYLLNQQTKSIYETSHSCFLLSFYNNKTFFCFLFCFLMTLFLLLHSIFSFFDSNMSNLLKTSLHSSNTLFPIHVFLFHFRSILRNPFVNFFCTLVLILVQMDQRCYSFIISPEEEW